MWFCVYGLPIYSSICLSIDQRHTLRTGDQSPNSRIKPIAKPKIVSLPFLLQPVGYFPSPQNKIYPPFRRSNQLELGHVHLYIHFHHCLHCSFKRWRSSCPKSLLSYARTPARIGSQDLRTKIAKGPQYLESPPDGPHVEAKQMASYSTCITFNTPAKYLGIEIHDAFELQTYGDAHCSKEHWIKTYESGGGDVCEEQVGDGHDPVRSVHFDSTLGQLEQFELNHEQPSPVHGPVPVFPSVQLTPMF